MNMMREFYDIFENPFDLRNKIHHGCLEGIQAIQHKLGTQPSAQLLFEGLKVGL